MTPAVMIIVMVFGWLSVASAMLWGMLRITRRRHARLSEPGPLLEDRCEPLTPPTATPRFVPRWILCVTARLKAVQWPSRDGAVW